ncbi:hypothetical protein [Mycolicibacterium setense]
MPTPELLSVDDLFAPPARAQASISPDGTRIAYLAPWRDRLNIWIQDVDNLDGEPQRVTADSTRSIIHYEWTKDSRWLLYMIKHDEGHGFVNPDNVIDMHKTVDRFLAEHLGEGRKA